MLSNGEVKNVKYGSLNESEKPFEASPSFSSDWFSEKRRGYGGKNTLFLNSPEHMFWIPEV